MMSAVAAGSKDGWRKVKFGEVVRQCKESVDRDNNPFERYVEGGHMDSEDIHIRRWGTFGEDYIGPAFHRIFRKGQVLYGSRRTYLKKVALAEFDGVCANTTFVLETVDQNVLMQELLPFLMLTDDFVSHSIRESKGSTNPYINWPDIAKYEFLLPPVHKQKKISEILWAADESVEKFNKATDELEVVLKLECNKLFKKDCLIEIKNLVENGIIYPPQDGNHGNDHPKSKDYVEKGIPFIMAGNLSNHRLDLENCKFLPKSLADKLRIGFSFEGDILLSHKGTVGEVAIVPSLDTPYVMLTPQVTYYRIKDRSELNSMFLFFAFISESFQKNLQRISAQSTRSYIGILAQKKLLIPFFDIECQNRIVKKLTNIYFQIDLVKNHCFESKKLSKHLINSILSKD